MDVNALIWPSARRGSIPGIGERRRPRVAAVLNVTVALLAAAPPLCAQSSVVVDFRNRIPGILDAPVFDADGATRLTAPASGMSYFVAQLYFSTSADGNDFLPVGVATAFGSAPADAGYWEPAQVVLPGVKMGQTVRLMVHAWEAFPSLESTLNGMAGLSAPVSVTATGSTITLAGLTSFSLVPEALTVERLGGAVVLSWPNLGASRYELDVSGSLGSGAWWASVPTGLGTVGFGESYRVTNAIGSQAKFFRLLRWR